MLASAAPAAAQAPGTGPGGPVLVVADRDGFGRYYAEILRAEGLNAFAVDGARARSTRSTLARIASWCSGRPR